MSRLCSIGGCKGKHKAKGLCDKCYYKMMNLKRTKSGEWRTEEYRKRSKSPEKRNRKKVYMRFYSKTDQYRKAHAARQKVYIAINKGIIKREACSVCGVLNTHGHHEDYDKPLEIIWLCPLHHKELHNGN